MGASLWRPIDWLGEWLGKRFPARNQMRLGIVLLLATIPLYGLAQQTKEPVGVFIMSAAALSFTGLGLVFTASVLLRQERDEEVFRKKLDLILELLQR